MKVDIIDYEGLFMTENMSKEELREFYSSQCRYYNGEKDSPYKLGDKRRTMWAIEANWVDFMVDDREIIKIAINDYVMMGLSHFEENDGTPLSLKAFMMNRVCQYAENESVNHFMDYYKLDYMSMEK